MPDRATEPQRWEDVPSMAYEPAQRLKAMDTDGVDYSVLYPTVAGIAGETFGRLKDAELELACVRAYNDWLIEEWTSVSPRFVPQCIVPLSPIAATVGEIRRAVAMGHRGVVFPSVPQQLRNLPHLNEPDYDPVWSTCEDLGVPICFHAGALPELQLATYAGFSPGIAAAFDTITRAPGSMPVIVNLLLSRILTRHPSLKVVFAETTLGWGAYLLEYTDHQFHEDGVQLEGYELRPSELFQRQCYFTGSYDRAGLATRHIVGLDSILWSTNFPLAVSTWPASHELIERNFADVPEDDRTRILWGNAATLYSLRER